MAKGIAHFGILFLLVFNTGPVSAMPVSDLLISEVMANPSALPDTRGEWFELYNPTRHEINLRDITIGDDDGDRHRIETDLLILPSVYLVLADNVHRHPRSLSSSRYVGPSRMRGSRINIFMSSHRSTRGVGPVGFRIHE